VAQRRTWLRGGRVSLSSYLKKPLSGGDLRFGKVGEEVLTRLKRAGCNGEVMQCDQEGERDGKQGFTKREGKHLTFFNRKKKAGLDQEGGKKGSVAEGPHHERGGKGRRISRGGKMVPSIVVIKAMGLKKGTF